MTQDRAQVILDLRTAAQKVEAALSRIPVDEKVCPTCNVKHYSSWETHIARQKVQGALTRLYDAISLLKKVARAEQEG